MIKAHLSRFAHFSKDKIKSATNKKNLQRIGVGLGVLLVAVLSLHLGAPTIKASNADVYKNQIASNAPFTIKFSQLMNRGSVEKAFKVEPAIAGDFGWTLNNLVFKPKERFTVGEIYTVTIDTSAKNLIGRALTQSYVTHFAVVDPPKVSLAVPNDETIVDTKITVMFDRPLVALTTLDELDSKTVPFKLDPPLEGKLKWLGTAAFQFIPTTRLAYSTQYTATVPAGVKTLDGGILESDYTFQFKTRRVSFSLENLSHGVLAASSPLRVRFNQDAHLDNLRDHVKLWQGETSVDFKAAYGKRTDVTYDDGKRIEKEVEDKTVVEILPKQGSFSYDSQYKIEISKGVLGIEGNLATENDLVEAFATGRFLTGNYPKDRDTSADPIHAISLSFDQDVNLQSVRSALSLNPAADLNIAYAKKCNPDWDSEKSPDEECPLVDDHMVVWATPKTPLKNLQAYTATLAKTVESQSGQQYLREDVVWTFTTADSFKVLRMDGGVGKIPSYKTFCLYTTNNVDLKDIEKQLEITPTVKRRIYTDSYSLEEGKYFGYEQTCRSKSKAERFALQIIVDLNPSSSYQIKLKTGAKDVYSQSLEKEFESAYKTSALLDEDRDMSFVQNKFYAISTPEQHATPVLQTQNLSDFSLEICKVSAETFLQIDSQPRRETNRAYTEIGWQGFAPSPENCEQYLNSPRSVPKVYWDKQYYEVNLAKELGGTPAPGYYLVRATSPNVYEMRTIYAPDGRSSLQKVLTQPTMLMGLTNFHVTLKHSKETALFWVTDILTGQPVSGVNFALFTEKGEPIEGSSTTNDQGVAKRAMHGLPFTYAIAEKGGQKLVVSQDETEGIAPWDFNISYESVQRSTHTYIYTERPLYQPTHEVFFKGIIRQDDDARLTVPPYKTITVTVRDNRDTEVFKKDLPITAQGTFNGFLKLDEKAALGRYTIAACRNEKGGDVCEFQFFSVEEYRKPEYKLEAIFSQPSYADKETLHATLKGSYFFGAPVPYGKVSWTLRSQNYYFDEYKGEWFSFTDVDTYRKCYFGCPYEDSAIANGEGQLDANGAMNISQQLDLARKNSEGKLMPPDTSALYTLDATVQDKNNQSVSVSQSVIVHRGEFYVGIKNEEYIVSAGESMPIKVITVDPKGVPLGGKDVKLTLSKVNWKYAKKKNVDGNFYWENERESKDVDSDTVTTEGDGMARTTFKVKEGGEYVVRATASDSKHNTFGSTVDFYASSSGEVSWKRDNNNRMEMKLDKMSYSVGDTAHLLVKSPYKGVKALVTNERGDVWGERVIDINANAQEIEIPITEKMIPNFFVSVIEVKGGNSTDNLPDFKIGYVNIVVDAHKKALNIELKPDKERYQPRDTVKLEITTTDSSGKPVAADLSLAAVDESLLALKGNDRPDILGFFYSRKYLGVWTADSMVNFLERVNVSDLKGAKGGSGKGATEYTEPRGKFEDTALWRSALSTDANGKVSISFTLPDNLTSWNIEAIGSTTASQFGIVNKTITTQKSVIVRPLLPRFVLFKDEVQLGAIVHNYTGSDNSFEVSIETQNLEVKGGTTKRVSIDNGGSQKILWDTVAPKVADGTRAVVTITAKAGASQDAVKQEFPIQSYSTPEAVALSSFTDDLSFSEQVVVPASVDPEFGELKITTGATLATYLADSLNYLLAYPYGCAEQIMSRIIPNVVLKNAVSLPNLKDKLKLAPIYDEKGKVVPFDTVVSTTLQRLYQFQRSDGGWGFFAESRQSYPSLTAYIIFGLDQIKRAGYSVDAGAVSRATVYIGDYMRSNRDLKDSVTGVLREKTKGWAAERAYMLFVMAETGHADVGLSNSLYEDRALLSNAGKAYLAMTLLRQGSGGQAPKIAELVKGLENAARIDARGTYVRSDEGSSYTMMTHVKTTAVALQALNRINPAHPLVPKLVKWLIAARKDGHWDTTQDTVASLIAMTEYLEKNKETQAAYAANILINGESVKQYSVGAATILDQQSLTQSIASLVGKTNKVSFTKEGTGRIYYDMVLKYFLPIEEIAPRAEGFNIERNYYRLDDKKYEHPVTEAKAGETLKGHMTLVIPDERHAVLLENALPAGFELINFEFKTSDKRLLENLDIPYDEFYDDGRYGAPGYYYGMGPWTHKELRDDRLLLFADALPKGVYEYDFYVQVTSEGKFHHPPAVISELYFPENFGRTKGEWMKVEE